MIRIAAKHAALWLCLVLVVTSSAFAQKYEIHPLVGRTMPLKWADLYTLKSTSIVGVKGLVYTNSDTQIEGEFQYLPHFEFRGTDPKIRAFVWGANVSRSFNGPKIRSCMSVGTVLPVIFSSARPRIT